MGNVNVNNEYMGNANVRSKWGNGGMLGVDVKNEYMGKEYGNVNVRNVRKF